MATQLFLVREDERRILGMIQIRHYFNDYLDYTVKPGISSKYTELKEKLDEILKYAYNSQQKLEIVPIEDGFIILNGEKFPIDRLNYNPLNNIEVMSGRFYLIPKKMEESFNIDFSDGKYHRNIIMHRVPDKSVNNMSFKSSDDDIPEEWSIFNLFAILFAIIRLRSLSTKLVRFSSGRV